MDENELKKLANLATLFIPKEESKYELESQRLRRENQNLNNEFNRIRNEMNHAMDNGSHTMSIEKHQAWVEEFITRFDYAIARISTAPEKPLDDYFTMAYFLDVINKNLINAATIRGLENKNLFLQTYKKCVDLFAKIVKEPEVQAHLFKQQEIRAEQDRLRREESAKHAALARAKRKKKNRILIVGSYVFLLVIFTVLGSKELLGITILGGIFLLVFFGVKRMAFLLLGQKRKIGAG